MLHLITGGTGDGKTLLAVWEILHLGMQKNRAANCLPVTSPGWEPLREFRSNIKGLKIPGVLPLEKDWRQYPDGTVCVYDESHKKGWFRTTGKPGLSDDDVITELDEHRHRGFDIYFITQYPTKIHNEVRQLIKHHIHLFRTLAMNRAMRWEWSQCVNDPYSHADVVAQNGEIWEFPEAGYLLYESASLHTHKFVMPKKIKALLVVLPFVLIVFGLLYWFLVRPVYASVEEPEGGKAAFAASPGSPFALGGKGGAQTAEGSVYGPGDEWEVVGVLPALKGCAVLSSSCRCWNGEGKQLRLSRDQCVALAARPLPIEFAVEVDQVGGVARAGVAAVGVAASSMEFPVSGSSVLSPGVGGGRPWIGDNQLPIVGRP